MVKFDFALSLRKFFSRKKKKLSRSKSQCDLDKVHVNPLYLSAPSLHFSGPTVEITSDSRTRTWSDCCSEDLPEPVLSLDLHLPPLQFIFNAARASDDSRASFTTVKHTDNNQPQLSREMLTTRVEKIKNSRKIRHLTGSKPTKLKINSFARKMNHPRSLPGKPLITRSLPDIYFGNLI